MSKPSAVLTQNQGFVITKDGTYEINRPQVNYNNELRQITMRTFRFDAVGEIENLQGRRFDANESTILREQLTVMVKKTMQLWYPDYTAKTMFPKSPIQGTGISQLKYVEDTWAGKARIASNLNTDVTLVSETSEPFYSPIFHLELAAQYSIYDLEDAARSGQPLEQKRLTNCRKGHEAAINDLIFGVSDDPAASAVPGLFNQISKLITSSDNSALANWNILTSSAVDNRDKLMAAINVPFSFTKSSNAIPDTISMPIAQAQFLASQFMDTTNTETVMNHILTKSSIKRVIAVPEFENVGINSVIDAMLIFRMDSDIAEIIETVPFMVLPTQAKLYNFLVLTRTSTGGLFIYKKAMALVKNVGTP